MRTKEKHEGRTPNLTFNIQHLTLEYKRNYVRYELNSMANLLDMMPL